MYFIIDPENNIITAIVETMSEQEELKRFQDSKFLNTDLLTEYKKDVGFKEGIWPKEDQQPAGAKNLLLL